MNKPISITVFQIGEKQESFKRLSVYAAQTSASLMQGTDLSEISDMVVISANCINTCSRYCRTALAITKIHGKEIRVSHYTEWHMK